MKMLLVGLVVVSGCYKSIGVKEVPRFPAPEVKAEEELVATDEVRRLDSWHFKHNGDVVQNTVREGAAQYGGQALTFHEVSALANPSGWKATLDRADDMRASCRRGEIPEYVATASLIAASIVGMAIVYTHSGEGNLSSREMLGVEAAYGLGGLAIGSYIVGYAMGGHACNSLEQFRAANHIDSKDTSWYDDDEIELVTKLASDFNAKRQAAVP